MRGFRLSALAFCLAAAMLPQPTLAGEVEVIDLGTLGGDHSTPTAINNRGQVVGHSQMDFWWGDEDPEFRAFLWYEGVMVNIGYEGAGAMSRANGINDRGQIVGSTLEVGATGLSAFLWDKGVLNTDLGLPSPSRALAINNWGQIVGYFVTGAGEIQSFLWDKGEWTVLGGPTTIPRSMNDRGQVVGDTINATGERRAFLWDAGTMIDLGTLGGTVQPFTFAGDINNRGQVVGYSRCDETRPDCDAGDIHGFLWEDGVMTDILDLTDGGTFGPDLRTRNFFPAAINNGGQIALSVLHDSGTYHVVVLSNGSVTDLGRGGPIDMNDNGQIVGLLDGTAHLWR